MNTENDKHVGIWSRQQSSNERSAADGNRTEEIQHGPAPLRPNVGITNYTGNNSNKLIQWDKQEMKEVVWCFMYVKATALTENYRAAYELWRKTNIKTKLLLNQKHCIFRNKHITDTDIDEIKENIRSHVLCNIEGHT
jgi:hypothetical protein